MVVDPLARSFEDVVDEYERSRPGWPDEAIARVSFELGLARPSRVLDLGAGTGKLTRALARRFEHVVAVEPLAGMRARLAREVPGTSVLTGSAEEIPLHAGEVEAVFCGESFHWFAGGRALAEIERVLSPRGGLVLLWNRLPDGLERPWPRAVAKLLDDHRASGLRPANRYGSGRWRQAFATSRFEPLREAIVPNPFQLDRDGLVEHFASWSAVAGLPEDERADLLTAVRASLPERMYRLQFETRVYWTRLSA